MHATGFVGNDAGNQTRAQEHVLFLSRRAAHGIREGTSGNGCFRKKINTSTATKAQCAWHALSLVAVRLV